MKNKLIQWLYVIVLGCILPSIFLEIIPVHNVIEDDRISEHKEDASIKTTIMVQQQDGTVEIMELEEYVRGVVLAEMPASFELEALKAQAVLARTYVLKRASAMDKHINSDVCTDSSCCQAFCSETEYKGDITAYSKVESAVDATAGQVLTYQDQLIEATYFSCSGGRTEDAVAVWGTEIPYLRATDSPGEEHSAHYTTTVVIDKQECLHKLGLTEGTLHIGPISYTNGDGVATIQIGNKTFTGVQIRQLLELKSTSFRMNLIGSNVIITVKGYGHRVGMSQYGADAMAVGGYDYKQILAHYYQGTVLQEYPI